MKEKWDPVEEALLELETARRARVFQSTEMASGLRSDPNETPTPVTGRQRAMRWAAVAAVLAITATVWMYLFQTELGRLHHHGVAGPAVRRITASARTIGRFDTCLKGPDTAIVERDCRLHDADADGDVDLRDFSRFQVAYVGP